MSAMNADPLAAGDSRTPVALRPGGPGDLDAVAALLTEAFLPDPIMSAITACTSGDGCPPTLRTKW